jgi:membrane protease YdiL (CAAX protease family)
MSNDFSNTKEQKPGWQELALYLIAGLGLYFLASLPVIFLLDGDFSNMSIGVTAGIGMLNAASLVGAVYLVGVRRGRISWSGLGFHPISLKPEWIVVAVLVSFALLPVRGLIGAAVEWIVRGNLDSLQVRGNVLFAGAELSLGNFLIAMLTIGILVPIAEELYFRGLLFRWFQLRMRFWPAVFLSSLLFGLAHYDSLAVIISSFILGFANAIAMARTKSIWVSIIMHMITNGTAVFLMYAVLLIEQYTELLI